jgi:hypothetical protein
MGWVVGWLGLAFVLFVIGRVAGRLPAGRMVTIAAALVAAVAPAALNLGIGLLLMSKPGTPYSQFDIDLVFHCVLAASVGFFGGPGLVVMERRRAKRL